MKRVFIAGLTALALLGAGAATLHVTGDNVAAASAAAKATVDAAKARGEVGEKITGYLEVVRDASPEVRRAVNEINIARKALYTRLARQQGVDPDVVAQLAGEKQLATAARGEYVMGADGRWTQR
jgi:uncharacterized protein YdbL (DUF1318 family)